MLKIDSIKIDIKTSGGLFGSKLFFKSGLNIVRANNTSGKSSLYGAIVYGLGFEELLGSKNDKALQSVFKSLVKEYVEGDINNVIQHDVLQSEILLEISNQIETVTIKRTIIHGSIKPQAVEVFFGKQISQPDELYKRTSMYLHDRGSATNEEIGFHKFLEGFIGLKLPEIINQEGKRVKLYLPLLSSCHFIEQKSGWSDFFANIPYYSIREASSKVFEYILNMDVFETAAVRQELQNKFRENEEKWKLQVDKIKTTVKRGGGEMVGLSEMPEIMSKEIKPYSRFYRGDKLLLLDEILNNIENESAIIDSEINQPLTKNLEKVQANLFELKDITERYENFYESLSSEINQEKERLRQYGHQLTNVNEDLKKNKDALKISNLGLNANFKIASGFCPTCNQTINDSLLNSNVVITPMRIDENISYLNAQEKMIHAFVNNLRSTILEKETKLASVEEAIQNNRQRIRALRKDLVSDDRLPSRELIERKVIIEREASLLNRLKEEIADGVTILYKLSKEFEKLRGEEKRLPQYYHSDNDNEKIIYFQDSFKRLINLFGFKSKPVDSIKISSEKYTPVYEIILDNGMKRFVDIRFESSASDFIRAQWAYYTSLMSTSIAKSGNHFLTLLFDEPQQQSAATVNFKAFLKELEKFKNEQVIVLASFQNSTEEYMDAISELSSFNEIDFAKSGGLIIEKLGN